MRTLNYSRRDFLKSIGLTAASLAIPGCANGYQKSRLRIPTDKPNFIIIFTDDQGYQDIGCFGSPDRSLSNPSLAASKASGAHRSARK